MFLIRVFSDKGIGIAVSIFLFLKEAVSSKYSVRTALAAVILCGLVLRMLFLGTYCLQFDEAVSLMEVRVLEAPRLSISLPTYRPFYLYNIFVSFWKTLGESETVLRFSSVLFGVLSIAALFCFTRRLLGGKTALTAALIFAVSPMQVHYSQELTVYASSLFFSIVSMYFFTGIITSPRFSDYAGVLICNVISVYCNHTAVFLPITQVICLVIYHEKLKTQLTPLGVLLVLQAVFLLPWVYVMVKQYRFMLHYTSGTGQISFFLPGVSPKNLLSTLRNFSAGYYSSGWLRTAGSGLMLSLAGFSLFRISGIDRKKFLLFLLFLLFPMAVLFLYSRHVILYADRYVLLSSVFLYILAAYAVSAARPKWKAVLLSCIVSSSVISLALYYSNNTELSPFERPGINLRKDFKGAADFLRTAGRPGDVFVHATETAVFPVYYYYRRSGFPGSKFPFRDTAPFLAEWLFGRREIPRLIIDEPDGRGLFVYECASPGLLDGEFKRRYGRLWLIISAWDTVDTGAWSGALVRELLKDYKQEREAAFPGVKLFLFRRNDENI
ncbi:MAG: glycosyltransferase family 39 protein [Candidatus Omnitrophota bacterium]